MRPKSVKKLQDRVRELTIRHQNLEAAMIEKLNPVIRGTALYFTPQWATTRWPLRRLNSWIRRRALGRKRRKRTDNYRLAHAKIAQRGLISLENFSGR